MRGWWGGLLLLALAVGSGAQDGQGYRLEGRRVVVEQAEHWRAWQAPLGVRLIDAEGAVRPRFLRRDTEVVADAGTFLRVEAGQDTVFGGIWAAGSNAEQAAHIIDGDGQTWWEPDRQDGLSSWFAEIDLGRAVIAERIEVRFAPEGQGDPFLKFRIMVSDGRQAFGQQRRRQFFRVAQETRPNKDRREFSFPIEPLRPVPEGLGGEIVQFVRIDALASDGPRGHLVSEAEYEGLPEQERGAVDFFRVTVAGREIPVLPETYALLPEQERGPVRHYRWERPRLAEVQVFTPGDNIVNLTQRELFEDQVLFGNLLRRQLTDGLHSSSFDLRVYDPIRDEHQLLIDLGAKYWLDRIRLLSPHNPPIAYQMRVSDGSLDPSGQLVWQDFDERLNPQSFLQLEEQFSPREVRHIELRRLNLIGSTAEVATLSEVQAYGEGYVSEVVMVSPLIRLGRPRIFSTVEWDGQAPPGTRVEVRTRSGDDLRVVTHHYDRFGREISPERWANSRVENRGPVETEEFPGPRWSNWSEVYDASGAAFKSPNPRQMLQVQARLLSVDPLRAAVLRRLRLNFSEPLVEQSFAEIWPVRGVEPGVEADFTLYLRPRFAPGDLGFDRIRLLSSSSAPMRLLEVRAGSDAALRAGGGEGLWPGRLQVEEGASGEIEVAFAEPVRGGDRIYAIAFRTRLFLNSTTFSAELLDRRRPGVVQVASEGEVSELSPSQSLVVVADLQQAPLLSEVAVLPRSFTPNGDGINDEVAIAFSVFRMEGETRFDAGVYDLAGRRVRDLSFARARASGQHRLLWDGLDESGARVSPGLYLVRVSFAPDAGGGQARFAAPVGVVY